MPISDDELIKGCKDNTRKMQFKLYEKYGGSMYLVCLRYTKAEQEAEDILQEAFIKVFQNIKKFRGDSSLGYWIKKIVINTALNFQRNKLYLYPMINVDTIGEFDSGQNFTLTSYEYNDLLDMIRELPTGCQVIFNLYAIEGYKHHEIASMLNINEGTSKSQYSRAKRLLQEKLNNINGMSYGRAE